MFEMMSILIKRNKLILNTSLILLGLGFFVGFCWPIILQYIMITDLKLSPDTISYKSWKKTPVPVYLDFYFFNWTNPDGFPAEKPRFTELGPYRYYEDRYKVNVTWNNNGTMSYRQVRSWFFSAEESVGNPSDLVTTLNVVALTAAYVVREYGFFHKKSVSMALAFTKQSMSVTKSVQELLFDGYDDNLMSFAVHISPKLSVLSSPFDKFAWFYKRNGSHIPDGWFNMDTGSEEISGIGNMMSWNFSPQTQFFQGKCGSVVGSTGDMFPPGLNRNTTLQLFSIDLCRTLTFEYSSDSEAEGISGYRYIGGPLFSDSGNIDPENSCYCNGECAPLGLLNVSSCRFGAPVFISFPHFYQADPSLLEQVEGLHPNKEEHEFYFTVEPVTGIPIDVAARLQINLLVQPISNIALYKNVPKMYFPVLWVDQRIRITKEVGSPIILLLTCRKWNPILAVVLLLSGVTLLGLTLIANTRKKKEEPCKPTPLIPQTHKN